MKKINIKSFFNTYFRIIHILRLRYYKLIYTAKNMPVKCDFVFSAGKDCRTAYMLKNINMRIFSAPLDWMMYYDLSVYLYLLQKREFDLFLNHEENYEWTGENRYISDQLTGMISLHDFDKGQEIKKQLPVFLSKMNRRLNYLVNSIQKSKNIGIVMNRDISFNEINSFSESLSQLFPHCIFHILNIKHDDSALNIYRKNLYRTNRYSIREISFNDTHPQGNSVGNSEKWKGNVPLWEKALLSSYSISSSINPDK